MKEQRPVTLQAEPEPLEIDLKRMAVIVVDMQNAFISSGGMFDLLGQDISNTGRVVGPIERILKAARNQGIKVVYIAHVVSPDLREVGPLSRFTYGGFYKLYFNRPETRDKLLLRGTWGAAIIDRLKPQSNEILIEKRRYSAFVGTDLDMMLKTHDIRYLTFVGVATNICVESSLRDAFHLEYLPILVEDAAAASLPARHAASIDNIKEVFGWVTTSKNLLEALG